MNNTYKENYVKLMSSSHIRVGIYARARLFNDYPESGEKICAEQISKIEDYIKNHENMSLDTSHIYVDNEIHGGTLRPQYDKLLQTIRNHTIDIVIVSELSRLFRKKAKELQLAELLTENNVYLIDLRSEAPWLINDHDQLCLFVEKLLDKEMRQVHDE